MSSIATKSWDLGGAGVFVPAYEGWAPGRQAAGRNPLPGSWLAAPGSRPGRSLATSPLSYLAVFTHPFMSQHQKNTKEKDSRCHNHSLPGLISTTLVHLFAHKTTHPLPHHSDTYLINSRELWVFKPYKVLGEDQTTAYSKTLPTNSRWNRYLAHKYFNRNINQDTGRRICHHSGSPLKMD